MPDQLNADAKTTLSNRRYAQNKQNEQKKRIKVVQELNKSMTTFALTNISK